MTELIVRGLQTMSHKISESEDRQGPNCIHFTMSSGGGGVCVGDAWCYMCVSFHRVLCPRCCEIPSLKVVQIKRVYLASSCENLEQIALLVT